MHADPTRRELHVLALLADGRSLEEISDELVLSLSTVRAHVRNLQRKTEVHSLHQLTAWTFKHGQCCVGPQGIRPLTETSADQ